MDPTLHHGVEKNVIFVENPHKIARSCCLFCIMDPIEAPQKEGLTLHYGVEKLQFLLKIHTK